MGYNLEEIAANLRLGKACEYRNMALFPILSEDLTEAVYLTLDEAYEKEKVICREVSEGGDVNRIEVQNLGSAMILILEGEELVAGRQGSNASSLASGKSHEEQEQ